MEFHIKLTEALPGQALLSNVWSATRGPAFKCDKTYFLFSQDLCGSNEERVRPNTVSESACCSVSSDPPEMKPHSYLEAICSGLEEDAEPGSSYTNGEQLCPYAAAGTCQFGDRCLYLHGQMCEICGLQVLHPFDPEQRKMHEKVSRARKISGFSMICYRLKNAI